MTVLSNDPRCSDKGDTNHQARSPSQDDPPNAVAGTNKGVGGNGEHKAPLPERSLIFLTPPEYPRIDVHPNAQFRHGNNSYNLFTTDDQHILRQGLELRYHSLASFSETSESAAIHAVEVEKVVETQKPNLRLPRGINAGDFCLAPAPSSRLTHKVVAIDCEMVGVFCCKPESRGERSELSQLCAVDVLTGEILIDKFVRPHEKVINWRTAYSGCSPRTIQDARRTNKLLHGWRAARAELLSYIDSETILVGHSIQNDLNILRLTHAKVVDTCVQTAEIVFGTPARRNRSWGLKELAKVLLNLDIQLGKRGHDCIEDTLATRELTLWCIRYPETLERWAQETRVLLKAQWIEREKRIAKMAEEHAAAEDVKKRVLELQSSVGKLALNVHDENRPTSAELRTE